MMTLHDISATVGSSIAITATLILMIKLGEFYNTTVNTVNKANDVLCKSGEIVDIVYSKKDAIDNSLNWIAKLPTASTPKNKNP